MTGARADHELLSDDQHDVWRYRSSGRAVLVDHPVNADLTRTWIRHGVYHVFVRVTFADWRPGPGGNLLAVEFRTDEQVKRTAEMNVYSRRHVDKSFWKFGTSGAARCRYGHAVSYERNQIWIKVPRSCLSRPRWVRVKITHYAHGTDAGGRNFNHWDNPHNDRPLSKTLTGRIGRDDVCRKCGEAKGRLVPVPW